MNIELSEDLIHLVKESGLYKVLKEEQFINESVTLTSEEKEYVKKLLNIDSDIYTIKELIDMYYDYLETLNIPEEIIYYVDVIAMITDCIINGELMFVNVKRNGRNMLLFYNVE